MIPPIFVAGTGEHIGKTTTTLGLAATIKSLGFNVGYSKPVGQKYLNVDGMRADKDAVLFSKVLDFSLEPEIHSPVLLGKGVTAQYVDNPGDFHFPEAIDFAHERLMEKHEILVYEGTGHPGVGAVVDLSNAQVAKRLGARVIMVAKGGIGSAVDRLIMSIALFQQEGVPVDGVIINKVLPEKMEKVRDYLTRRLADFNLPVLGMLPFDKTLSYPIMETIKRAVRGRVIFHPEAMNNRVEDIVAGSLIDTEDFNTLQNVLLVVSYKRMDEAIDKIRRITANKGLDTTPLAGMIVTGDGRHAYSYSKSDFKSDYFDEFQIPLLTTSLDTLGSVTKISRIEVKINTRTPWKIQRAIELFGQNVNMQAILNV
jgi:dethiobiotin synthetase